MNYGKSPASREAGRGLFLPLFLFLVSAVVSLPGISQSAASAISASQNFYDYEFISPGVRDRLTGQAVVWMLDRSKYKIGINAERAGFAVPGSVWEFFNASLLIEKPLLRGVSIGVGTGFVKAFSNGASAMLSHVNDIYGRVQLLKIGNASVGTFVAARWVNPTPFGTAVRVVKSGIEVGFGR